MIEDGQPGPEYDGILGKISFNADGTSLAYAANLGNKSYVVVNGRAGSDYEAIASGPVWRADGTMECLVLDKDSLYRVSKR